MELTAVFEKYNNKYRLMGVCTSKEKADSLAVMTAAIGVGHNAYSFEYTVNTTYNDDDSIYVVYVKNPEDKTKGGCKEMVTIENVPTAKDFFIYKNKNSADSRLENIIDTNKVEGEAVCHVIKLNTIYLYT